jgi:proline iminopeptidase
VSELRVAHRGASLWTRVLGDAATGTPLVCVPGGPGLAHDYLANLGALAARGRAVVFYDPFGAGRSPAPADTTYTLETLRDEIETVRAALGLTRMHVLAQSAGSFPALEYALAHPDRVASLTLASPMIDIPTYAKEVRRRLDELGIETASAFVRAEVDPRLRDASYARTYYAYVTQHLCRFTDARQFFALTGRGFNTAAHRALKHGSLFYLKPPLDRWNVTPRLPEIAVPVLITCGAHDVMTPALCEVAVRTLARGELAVFEHSTHTQHVEEPARFLDVVAAFLDRSER